MNGMSPSPALPMFQNGAWDLRRGHLAASAMDDAIGNRGREEVAGTDPA